MDPETKQQLYTHNNTFRNDIDYDTTDIIEQE